MKNYKVLLILNYARSQCGFLTALKRFRSMISLTLLVCALSACKKEKTEPFDITFTPNEMQAGGMVAIEGNFSFKDSTSFGVYFGDFKGIVKELHDNKILVEVPSISTPLVDPLVTITLKTGHGKLTARGEFLLLPTFDGFSPVSGPPGTRITLHGRNLPLYMSDKRIKIYLQDTYLPWDNTQQLPGVIVPDTASTGPHFVFSTHPINENYVYMRLLGNFRVEP